VYRTNTLQKYYKDFTESNQILARIS